MQKLNWLILATFLVLASAGQFSDRVEKNKNIVSSFWANGVTYTNVERTFPQELIDNDVTAIAWSDNKVTGTYVERQNGKALVLGYGLSLMISARDCSAICRQWKSLIFPDANTAIVDISVYMTQTAAQKALKQGILITKNTKNFNATQLYADWLAGKTGPLILQNLCDTDSKSDYIKLSSLLGVYLIQSSFFTASMTNLRYEAKYPFLPYGLILQAWTESINNHATYPLMINPNVDLELYPRYAEDLYSFLAKYDSMLESNPVNSKTPITDVSTTHPFSLQFFKDYTTMSYSQTLKNIDLDRLKELTYNYGTIGGLSEDTTLEEPTTGEFIVTMESRGVIALPTGLDQKPHSIIEYEILTESISPVGFVVITGALTDNLLGKTALRRVPIVNSRDVMEKVGRFYSPIGGPILVGTGSYKGVVKFKFRNVYRTPGLNLRDPATSVIWDGGAFKNTRARWATLICDVLFMNVEMSYVQTYTAKQLEEICTVHDHVTKSFGNFIDSDVMQRERLQVVYDSQPSTGLAHAGQPIVCPTGWSSLLLGMANFYFRQTDVAAYWGLLHEIGHMFQPAAWKFGIFGETTNNVLVMMFIERYFKKTWSDNIFHAAAMNIKALSARLNGNVEAFDTVWAGLHFHYHLVPSFGWALYGNVYHRYTSENNDTDISLDRFMKYLSLECGYNLIPYAYYFRFGFLYKNMMGVYNELTHLPTYKPYDLLLESGMPGWTETKNLFGFTNDVQVVKMLNFTFDTDRFFDQIGNPSPVIEQL